MRSTCHVKLLTAHAAYACRNTSPELALATLAPLGTCLTSLCVRLTEHSGATSDNTEGVIKLPHAQALASALPGLKVLDASWGRSIEGPALEVLLAQLVDLEELVLSPTCPVADLAAAVGAAQQQLQARGRKSPVKVLLTGYWNRRTASEAEEAAALALNGTDEQPMVEELVCVEADEDLEIPSDEMPWDPPGYSDD